MGEQIFNVPTGLSTKIKLIRKVRPFQKIYHAGFKVKLSLAENEDGTWSTVNCQVDNHEGHPISEEAFLTYKRSRKVNDKDMKLIEDLIEGEAQPPIFLMEEKIWELLMMPNSLEM